MRIASSFLCLFVALLTGCANSDKAAPPANVAAAPTIAAPSYLTAEKGCAVVAGGAIGSMFADPKITEFWYEANRQVTEHLYDDLAKGQFKVVKLIVPVEKLEANKQLVIQELAKNRCSRLIQVSHSVGEDGEGKFFRFDVAMIRLVPQRDGAVAAGGTNVATLGEFTREYRYPRNEASFASFRTGTFADTVYADLKKSGALNALR